MMSKKFLIPVSWSVSADMVIEAETLEEAIERAVDASLPEHGEYIDSSFEVDEALIYENLHYYGEQENPEDFLGTLPNQFKFIGKVNSLTKDLVYRAERNNSKKSKFLVSWGWEENKQEGIEKFDGQCEYTERELCEEISNGKYVIIN